MIEIKSNCPVCKRSLEREEDSIHFYCRRCGISWHAEDLGGKIEEVKKLIRFGNRDSLSYKKAERGAYNLLFSHSWYIWGLSGTANPEESRRNDILLIHKKTEMEFVVRSWKRTYYQSGKRIHAWHYECLLGDVPACDGEISGSYRSARQCRVVDAVIERLDDLLEESDNCEERVREALSDR